MVSFAVAGLSGYLTTNIADQLKELEKGGNPLGAVTNAYGETFLLLACIACAGLLLSLILRRPKRKAEEDEVEVEPTV